MSSSLGPQWGYGIADRIDVDLFHEDAPYNSAGISISGIDLSTTGLATFQVLSDNVANYYIRVRNRNHVEVWSAIAVPFNTPVVEYSFMSDVNQAFGYDALVQVATNTFALFCGDVDQGGWVDSDDFNVVDIDLTNGAAGFVPSDFNGGGWVDSDDFNLFEPRLSQGIASQYPGK